MPRVEVNHEGTVGLYVGGLGAGTSVSVSLYCVGIALPSDADGEPVLADFTAPADGCGASLVRQPPGSLESRHRARRLCLDPHEPRLRWARPRPGPAASRIVHDACCWPPARSISSDAGCCAGPTGPSSPRARPEAFITWFCAHPGAVVSRDELLARIWGYSDAVISRASDNVIRRLREKSRQTRSAPSTS